MRREKPPLYCTVGIKKNAKNTAVSKGDERLENIENNKRKTGMAGELRYPMA